MVQDWNRIRTRVAQDWYIIEEGVDKLGKSIGHTGRPIEDGVERLSTELEFEFYDDRWLEIK